jgi:D-lactate dehydrogenase (cytochrome)
VPAPPEASFGVLIVLESAEDAGIDEALDVILDISESAGFSDQNIWAADSDDLMRKFQMLRHGIPEAINAQLDINRIANPSFMKMGIDIQFGYTGCNISKSLADVTDIMNNTNVLAALFSHIGNKHMHINFLPGNEKEYRVCEVARAELYARTVKSGGILFAENGIGKLKRDILADYVSEDVLTAMRRVKKFFDPEGRLNPGNML